MLLKKSRHALGASYGLSLAPFLEPTYCGLMRTGRREVEFFNSIGQKRWFGCRISGSNVGTS